MIDGNGTSRHMGSGSHGVDITSGIYCPLFDKRTFEFSYLGPSATQTITLQHLIDCIPYGFIGLLIRVHRLTALVGAQSLVVSLHNVLPSEEDPQDFVDMTGGSLVTVASVTIQSGTTAPSLLISTATNPGPFLKCVATVSQALSGGTTFFVEASGGLLLRTTYPR